MQKKEHILIIGAGLCGSLLALRMAQQGYSIDLVEKRPDLRKADISAGRSINLAFSDRGMKGMKLVGLEEKVTELCIPMYGRMLHDREGNTKLSKYSGRDHEYINSISRGGLNALLLDEIEQFENVQLHFNLSCKEVDLKETKAVFTNENGEEITLKADYIFGTDGAGSVVRKSMMQQRDFLFSFSQNFLTHGYKELSFPATKDNSYAADAGALHIWPRGENMLIALPNLDKTFTVTLFLAYEGGDYNFNNLTHPEMVKEYFQKEYPDALALMPDLATEYFENPTAPLGTVRCSPWTYRNALIMGDAAHAIVPFYGQGMNASFEDVVEFDQILQAQDFDFTEAFQQFSKSRKKDADAIADLALDNFHEMKSHTANDLFLKKRKLEIAFETEFPDEYSSKYSLVTFEEGISYDEALQKGRAQDHAILRLLKNNQLKKDETLATQLQQVQEETKVILEEQELL
ncbi:FAD-dependent oxidoreductase [Psychroflexus planctonicus]|uniref:Kynurenine 3-monooxygenase n=1 Tax=Psychroflexus planctonicus TaxID=1526575 RepID=A0ABQ1SD23_9FLAO|nr:NAD(P)/FAD-dependent oxidoreductase [Psychroflexus planctonicus]GGE29475.1 kynurenine 3-monooxygenase [Psychroflexus planctonicus]